MTYGVNFGPFPFTPNDASIARIKPLLKEYGEITNVIIYGDRTVTIGFALGARPMPKTRKRLPLIISKRCVGVLMAPFHIKMLGVSACNFCPAIDDNSHTPACEENKKDREKFLTRKVKKLGALKAGRAPPQEEGEISAAHVPLSRTVLSRLDAQLQAGGVRG